MGDDDRGVRAIFPCAARGAFPPVLLGTAADSRERPHAPQISPCRCPAAPQILLENAAEHLGLSKAQIIMAIAYLLTLLILLVTFILITIGAWNNESSFNALVQGTLISGAGKAVTALRQKSKAEDGESLEGLVDQILDGQKDAAAEAE